MKCHWNTNLCDWHCVCSQPVTYKEGFFSRAWLCCEFAEEDLGEGFAQKFIWVPFFLWAGGKCRSLSQGQIQVFTWTQWGSQARLPSPSPILDTVPNNINITSVISSNINPHATGLLPILAFHPCLFATSPLTLPKVSEMNKNNEKRIIKRPWNW